MGTKPTGTNMNRQTGTEQTERKWN